MRSFVPWLKSLLSKRREYHCCSLCDAWRTQPGPAPPLRRWRDTDHPRKAGIGPR